VERSGTKVFNSIEKERDLGLLLNVKEAPSKKIFRKAGERLCSVVSISLAFREKKCTATVRSDMANLKDEKPKNFMPVAEKVSALLGLRSPEEMSIWLKKVRFSRRSG